MNKNILILGLLLSGCTTNFYEESFIPSNISPENCITNLKNSPILVEIHSNDEVITYEAEGYCVLGKSIFNEQFQSRAYAIDYAKKIGASRILVGVKRNSSSIQSTSSSAENIAQWNQYAYFLAPMVNSNNYGVYFDSIPNIPGQKDEAVRVKSVLKNSLADKKGIKAGDILVSINGQSIGNHMALKKFMKNNPEIKNVEVINGY